MLQIGAITIVDVPQFHVRPLQPRRLMRYSHNSAGIAKQKARGASGAFDKPWEGLLPVRPSRRRKRRTLMPMLMQGSGGGTEEDKEGAKASNKQSCRRRRWAPSAKLGGTDPRSSSAVVPRRGSHLI